MFYHGRCDGAASFSLVRQAFLQGDGLPFAEVLSEDEIREAFEAENVHFAQGVDDIYTPPLTLWAFLSQALHGDKGRACLAAVSRVIVLCVALGRKPPSPDTGTYCRARAKLPESVLQRLVYRSADQLESRLTTPQSELSSHGATGLQAAVWRRSDEPLLERRGTGGARHDGRRNSPEASQSGLTSVQKSTSSCPRTSA